MTEIEIFFNDGRIMKYEIDDDRPYGTNTISYAFIDKKTGEKIHIFPISVSMIRIIEDSKIENNKIII